MRPLMLNMHEEYREEMRQLRATELEAVGGAEPCQTLTVYGDEGGVHDDGTDCC